MIPVLMITCNRIEYSKKALDSLLKCRNATPIIIDNGSTDGTKKWLAETGQTVLYNLINIGIAGAMNQFLGLTRNNLIVGKIDNDTLVPPDFIEKMLPHLDHADIVQAKHKLIDASGVGTFDEWTAKMPAKGALRFNAFVGGAGILFKRKLVTRIPETQSKIMGWRQFQRNHPEIVKAFATDCEIHLLDEKGYDDYPEYYKMTGRC